MRIPGKVRRAMAVVAALVCMVHLGSGCASPRAIHGSSETPMQFQ